MFDPNLIEIMSNNLFLRRYAFSDCSKKKIQAMKLFVYPYKLYKFPADTEEFNKLTEALQLTKSLLEYVNQEARECQNARKVDDLQKRLDRRSIDSSNLLLQVCFEILRIYFYIFASKVP